MNDLGRGKKFSLRVTREDGSVLELNAVSNDLTFNVAATYEHVPIYGKDGTFPEVTDFHDTGKRGLTFTANWMEKSSDS